jgi:hypothetical protein
MYSVTVPARAASSLIAERIPPSMKPRSHEFEREIVGSS